MTEYEATLKAKKHDKNILMEELFKQYYIEHPELNLDAPCENSISLSLILDHGIIDEKYNNETEGVNTAKFSIRTKDHTMAVNGIFAFISPNYAPCEIHRHEFIEIAYMLNGSCINYSGNTHFELKKGDMLIMSPNTSHGISMFNDDSLLINILVSAEIFDEYFFGILSETDIYYPLFKSALYNYSINSYILFHTLRDEAIAATVIQLTNLFEWNGAYKNDSASGDKLAKSLLRLLLNQLTFCHSLNADIFSDDAKAANENIVTILEYIQNNFAILSLNELSQAFGYSARHMRRILLKYTHRNFEDIILLVKMNKAARMLLSSSNTIEYISGILGYSTPYGFRKRFKEYYKVTPSQYRKDNS